MAHFLLLFFISQFSFLCDFFDTFPSPLFSTTLSSLFQLLFSPLLSVSLFHLSPLPFFSFCFFLFALGPLIAPLVFFMDQGIFSSGLLLHYPMAVSVYCSFFLFGIWSIVLVRLWNAWVWIDSLESV